VPFSFPNRLARPLCRAVSLLAYGLTGPLYAYASGVMLAAYNDVCPPGNRFLERESADDAALSTLIMLAVFVLPVLLSRSNVVIGVNLVASLLALLLAVRLPFIAQTPPYQCVTQGGSYEDHVSGLPEFELYLLFILFLSYILLLIDWGVWTARLLPRAFRRPANASAPGHDG
jgi:hypothetical protein